MKKTLFALCVASMVATVGAQVPSQTYHQQAVLKDGTPVTVRNTEGLQVITEGTPTMTNKAYEARRAIRSKQIQIDRNGNALLSGSVRGLGMDVYHFSGNAGDSIRILNQKGGTAMEFAIFRPDIGLRFGAHQVLPESGDYELRIVNNRRNLPQNKKAYPYHVKFTLVQGNGQSVAPTQITTAQPASAAPVVMTANVNGQGVALQNYVCSEGAFQATVVSKSQAIFSFKGKSVVLPFQPAASNQQTGVYGSGHLVLETLGYQDRPIIARLIANGHVSRQNCMPSN